MALGYLAGKASSKLLNARLNIPLIFTASILPDVDLLLEPALEHGGPPHSIIILATIFLPAFLVWKKETIPYFAAAVSHPLLGDYLTRWKGSKGLQLLFPLNSSWFSAGSANAQLTYIYAELALFTAFMTLMLATRDVTILIKPHPSNMLLLIPIFTALLPVFLRFPTPAPPELIIPHLVLIAVFTLPILIDIVHAMHRKNRL